MFPFRSADPWSAKCKIEARRSGPDFERKKEPEDRKLPRLFTETGEAEGIRFLLPSGQRRGDDGHLVDLFGVAAAAEVVDRRVQTLQDGAVRGVAAETLGDLVADVAGLDLREDEGVGIAGDLAAGELALRTRSTFAPLPEPLVE